MSTLTTRGGSPGPDRAHSGRPRRRGRRHRLG